MAISLLHGSGIAKDRSIPPPPAAPNGVNSHLQHPHAPMNNHTATPSLGRGIRIGSISCPVPSEPPTGIGWESNGYYTIGQALKSSWVSPHIPPLFCFVPTSLFNSTIIALSLYFTAFNNQLAGLYAHSCHAVKVVVSICASGPWAWPVESISIRTFSQKKKLNYRN